MRRVPGPPRLTRNNCGPGCTRFPFARRNGGVQTLSRDLQLAVQAAVAFVTPTSRTAPPDLIYLRKWMDQRQRAFVRANGGLVIYLTGAAHFNDADRRAAHNLCRTNPDHRRTLRHCAFEICPELIRSNCGLSPCACTDQVLAGDAVASLRARSMFPDVANPPFGFMHAAKSQPDS